LIADFRSADEGTWLVGPATSQYGQPDPAIGRILSSHGDETTAELHDYVDVRTGIFAAKLAKRAPGCAGLGFSDPRGFALAPDRTGGQLTGSASQLTSR
jgi:hypothetical protein